MRVLTVALSGLFALGVGDAPGERLLRALERTAAASRQDRPARRADPASRIRERAATIRQAPSAGEWKRGPRGFATYYAQLLDGRRTASGVVFDNDELVAAHPVYPFGTLVRVTNLRNGRSVTVTIVDRGPVRSARASGVIIDLSRAAAEELDFIRAGRTRVRLEIREPESEEDDDESSAGTLTSPAGARRRAAAGDP